MTQMIQTIYKTVKMSICILLLAHLCACEPIHSTSLSGTNTARPPKPNGAHKQVWGRMRENFKIARKQDNAQHQQIQKHIKKFTRQEKNLAKVSLQASPYLYYIVEQLEKRNMPGELALLPMIESNFQPGAISHRGAAGLWQFIPSTGRIYGLKQDAWYDGRRDIKASTDAALNYLSFLHKEFDNNWMLALAAYNAGEGAVHRAIKRNKRAGKPITFWDLQLPKETREYVPKFLALAQVIANPEGHDISLPAIDNKPYFSFVNPGIAIHFNQAAKLADIDLSELKRLNPGYRQSTTHPKPQGPKGLLLPIANAQKFEYNLANKR